MKNKKKQAKQTKQTFMYKIVQEILGNNKIWHSSSYILVHTYVITTIILQNVMLNHDGCLMLSFCRLIKTLRHMLYCVL